MSSAPRLSFSENSPKARLSSGSHTLLSFWHGLLPNEDTARLLPEEASFLLRQNPMEKMEGPLLLSVRVGHRILNAIVQLEKDGRYSLGGKCGDSVEKVVDYYHIRKKPLNIMGTNVMLGHPVGRQIWELTHNMVELNQELGLGSYGVVFRGILRRGNEKPIEVAIKLLSEMSTEACSALWKEARVMQNYHHENVVKFYGIVNDCRPYYLVLEYVSGGSVDNHLKKFPKLPKVKRVKILLDAAKGVDYLHSQKCIHRDIAARNLLITKEEITKVADFGLTRKAKTYKIDRNQPCNLRWLAPDAFEKEEVTAKTDVYAFGVTIWEVFETPFNIPYYAWDADTVFEKVVEGGFRLSPPPATPKRVAQAMRDCLAPNPLERPTFKVIVLILWAEYKEMLLPNLKGSK